MRLIDADALKKEFGYTDEWYKGRTVCAIIDNAPTITPTLQLEDITDEDIAKFAMIWQRATGKGLILEPERPQGKWEFDSKHTEFGNPYGTYKCSCCGGHSSDKYPYCFWCGAQMNGGEDND